MFRLNLELQSFQSPYTRTFLTEKSIKPCEFLIKNWHHSTKWRRWKREIFMMLRPRRLNDLFCVLFPTSSTKITHSFEGFFFHLFSSSDRGRWKNSLLSEKLFSLLPNACPRYCIMLLTMKWQLFDCLFPSPCFTFSLDHEKEGGGEKCSLASHEFKNLFQRFYREENLC